MNEIQKFFYDGKEVRTVQLEGEVWWVIRDVCNVLGLTNPSMIADRLDDDERTKFNLGRQGFTNVVNERGLYAIILRSDKPIAKPFKRWVTHEVLPSIRKHGAYITPDKLEEVMNDPDMWIEMITALKNEREANNQLRLEVTKSKPKVLFADAVSASDGTILIGELAKILKGNGVDIGQNRLFDKLRQDGFLIKRKGMDYNSPTQRGMEMKLFKVKETVIAHPDGSTSINRTTKVTGKGQVFFVNYFLNRGGI